MTPNIRHQNLFISVFNSGSLRLALNHLESLRREGVDNYLAFTLDENALTKAIDAGHYATLATLAGAQSQTCQFGSQEFNHVSYLRYPIIADLLSQGVNVWYLDVDTVCLRNLNSVFELFIKSSNLMTLQSDLNMLCTGCMILRSANASVNFLRELFSRANTEQNDQLVFNELLAKSPQLKKRTGVLPINEFPCGQIYFDPPYVNPREKYFDVRRHFQPEAASLVHANWMIGNDTKENALKNAGLWFIN